MAVSKEILNQYMNLQIEIKGLRPKIEKLEARVKKIENRLAEIEAGEIVKDKVRGGLGGVQSFTIEGIPTKEYSERKMELYVKRKLLVSRKEMLEALEMDDLLQTREVETFIRSIKDTHTRRIVTLRIVDGMSWKEVADKMGGMNTEDSVRMAFNRLFPTKNDKKIEEN